MSKGGQRSENIARQLSLPDARVHLDMTSNDDMFLIAFDLTILPIIGKNMEHLPAEVPGQSSAPALIEHVL